MSPFALHPLFRTLLNEAEPNLNTGWPAMDVNKVEDGAVLTFDLPGVNPEDIELQAIDDRLTISGKRPASEDVQYVRRERPTGEFNRTLVLPFAIDADATQADYQHGVLTVKVKSQQAAQTKRITVQHSTAN